MDNSGIKLNQEQKVAVEHGEGPLLIIAGAGTGKTTVITERIKHLISSGLAKPNEILALTFTEKAATEMQERVDIALPLGYSQMFIGTFHSFCDMILRDNAANIGLNTDFRLLNEAENIKFIKDNIFDLKLKEYQTVGNPEKYAVGLMQHFSRLQDECITPAEYAKWVRTAKLSSDEKIKYTELSRAYENYDQLKIKNAVMDFGDLIIKTVELFRKRKFILSKYQDRYKFILIDEFQDTNIAQNELVLLLGEKHKNITVSGDDDQAIYRFRGATVKNILSFRQNFSDAKTVVLNNNYRNGQKILDAAYQLINHNNPDRLEITEKVDKKLKSEVAGEGETVLMHAQNSDKEVRCVAEKITELIEKLDETNYQDIAVLVRANNHANDFVTVFQKYDIPYVFYGPGSFFDNREIDELVSYVKTLYDPDDTLSLYKVLSMAHLGIQGRVLIRLTGFARRNNMSLYEVLTLLQSEEDGDLIKIVDGENKKKLLEVLTLINTHLDNSRSKSAGELIYEFMSETGLVRILMEATTLLVQRKAENINKFFDKLSNFERDNKSADLFSVIDWIELSKEYKGEKEIDTELISQNNAVSIMTIHSAKGLEFPIVFMPFLVNERFPSRKQSDQIPLPNKLSRDNSDDHMAEERRLFYVAMTRAKQKLFLSFADYYGDGVRKKRPSPFVVEALGSEYVAEKIQPKLSNGEVYKKENSNVSDNDSLEVKPITYMSYSQMHAFELCPLHYKLEYVLKIPSRPNSNTSFGTSMHSAIEEIVKNNYDADRKLFTEILKKHWVKAGYKSKAHEAKRFKRGVDQLFEYIKDNFPIQPKVLGLETSFSTRIDSAIHKRALKIGGKIDRIDKIPGGVEIIDYKTSEREVSQRDVDKDTQLTFYALAISKLQEAPLDVKLDKIKFSLYFFETQQKFTTQRTLEDIRKMEEKVFETCGKIEESDFKCSGNYLCRQCDYKDLCNIGDL